MKGNRPGYRLLWLALMLSIPLAVTGLHGQEEAAPDTASVMTAAPAPTNWDSLYAVINSNYQRVEPLFRRGCFDCHSDQTEYPWYHSLPFVRGFLDNHIEEGRKHLDLSNGFPFKGRRQRADDLYEIREQLVEGEMPLWSYTLIHWGAGPDEVETDSILAWIDESLGLLAAHGQYPFGRPELLENLGSESDEED